MTLNDIHDESADLIVSAVAWAIGVAVGLAGNARLSDEVAPKVIIKHCAARVNFVRQEPRRVALQALRVQAERERTAQLVRTNCWSFAILVVASIK